MLKIFGHLSGDMKNFSFFLFFTKNLYQLNAMVTSFFLFSFLFGVTYAPLACQHRGLPHRLAQCATPGKGLV